MKVDQIHRALLDRLAYIRINGLQHKDPQYETGEGMMIRGIAELIHQFGSTPTNEFSQDMWDDIKCFHEKFLREYTGPGRLLPEDLQEFREITMAEELGEYKEAVESGNKEEILDALVDLVYFAIGTVYLHGFNFPEAWRRVHKANMQKVISKGEGSDRGGEFDVVKPEGWEAPNLGDLVK